MFGIAIHQPLNENPKSIHFIEAGSILRLITAGQNKTGICGYVAPLGIKGAGHPLPGWIL